MKEKKEMDEVRGEAQYAREGAEASVDEDDENDIGKQEEALQALKLVRAMLPSAGHDKPDKPDVLTVWHENEAEYAALRALRVAYFRGEWGKAKAIKAYREHADVGLRDAKLAVDNLADRYEL